MEGTRGRHWRESIPAPRRARASGWPAWCATWMARWGGPSGAWCRPVPI